MISKDLKEYLVSQTIEESCDNIIPENVAVILRELNLVKREYNLKGSIQNQRCLVIFEGSSEENFQDAIKFRVNL